MKQTHNQKTFSSEEMEKIMSILGKFMNENVSNVLSQVNSFRMYVFSVDI